MILKFEDFIKESMGQEILKRKTNKPYSTKTDPLFIKSRVRNKNWYLSKIQYFIDNLIINHNLYPNTTYFSLGLIGPNIDAEYDINVGCSKISDNYYIIDSFGSKSYELKYDMSNAYESILKALNNNRDFDEDETVESIVISWDERNIGYDHELMDIEDEDFANAQQIYEDSVEILKSTYKYMSHDPNIRKSNDGSNMLYSYDIPKFVDAFNKAYEKNNRFYKK